MTTVLLKVGPLGRIVQGEPRTKTIRRDPRPSSARDEERSDPRRLAGSDLGCERTSLIDLERPPNIGDGVDLSRPIVITRTTEIGATLPLTVVAAKDDCPPGGAIRGPSSSSTALDPERTAQTDPKRTGGVSTQASGRGFHFLKNALAFLQTIFSTFDWFMPPSKADLGNTKHGTSSRCSRAFARSSASRSGHARSTDSESRSGWTAHEGILSLTPIFLAGPTSPTRAVATRSRCTTTADHRSAPSRCGTWNSLSHRPRACLRSSLPRGVRNSLTIPLLFQIGEHSICPQESREQQRQRFSPDPSP